MAEKCPVKSTRCSQGSERIVDQLLWIAFASLDVIDNVSSQKLARFGGLFGAGERAARFEDRRPRSFKRRNEKRRGARVKTASIGRRISVHPWHANVIGSDRRPPTTAWLVIGTILRREIRAVRQVADRTEWCVTRAIGTSRRLCPATADIAALPLYIHLARHVRAFGVEQRA